MEQKINQTLEKISASNKDLKQRMTQENWSISYDKKTDMFSIGGVFPANSSYVPLGDGTLIRIDTNHRICGFSVENTKLFMVENPDVGFALSFYVYPVRSYLQLPFYFLMHHTTRGFSDVLSKMKMRVMTSLSDHVAGRTMFA